MLRYGILMLATAAVNVAMAAESPKRLIETGPGERAWMTEEQIEQISEKRHLAGKCGGFFDVTELAADAKGLSTRLKEEPPALLTKAAFRARVPNQQRAVE